MTTESDGMHIDVHLLRTFSRLANSGAQRAANALSQMTDIETFVDVTRVELSTRTKVSREFVGADRVSVCIGFDGGLSGESILAFDLESAERVAESLLPGQSPDPAVATSGITELGNIMVGGFIDGWADYLDTSIDISTPTYVADQAGPPEALDDVAGEGDELLVFRNHLETAENAVDFTLYMIPTATSASRVLEACAGSDTGLPLRSVATFDEMIADGAAQASADITAMTGIETEVAVSRLSFVPLEDVPMLVPNEPRTGVMLEFEGLPSGYIVILFDESSASRIAESLLPDGADESAEMRQSAIQEVGNIVTSGFVDGWANALETTIDISPPQFVDDFGRSAVAPVASKLAQHQQHAFLIDSAIRMDGDEFTCDIYALPDEAELRRTLNELTTRVP